MNTQSSKSILFKKPNTVSLEELPIKGEGELLRSRLMGISSGSERRVLAGECSGIDGGSFMDCGETGLQFPFYYGYINVCENDKGKRFFAFYPHQSAFYSHGVQLYPIPQDIDDEDALFLANMETALGMVQDLGPLPGERFMVMGCGIVGLLAAAILHSLLPQKLLIADVLPSKEKYARMMSVDFLDLKQMDWKKQFLQSWGPIDGGINASGQGKGMDDLMDISGSEARLVEGSWYGNNKVALNLGQNFHWKRLKIISSQVSHIPSSLSGRWSKERRFEFCWELIRKLKPSKLISHRYSLDEFQQAYDTLMSQKEQMQITLKP